MEHFFGLTAKALMDPGKKVCNKENALTQMKKEIKIKDYINKESK